MSNREKLTQGINYKIIEKTKEQRGESGHTELRNAVLLGSQGTAGAAAAAARARSRRKQMASLPLLLFKSSPSPFIGRT